MGKFRKRPVVIDAVQFDPCVAHKTQLPEGVEVIEHVGFPDNYCYEGIRFGIRTLEGVMEVRPRDWVITGVQGERYPCKPDIFDLTYEAVPDA